MPHKIPKPDIKTTWVFQEFWVEWSMFGFGYQKVINNGWQSHTLTVYLGFARIEYVGEETLTVTVADHEVHDYETSEFTNIPTFKSATKPAEHPNSDI